MRVYICVCMNACMNALVRVCMYLLVYVHMHGCMRTNVRSALHEFDDKNKESIYMHAHTYMYVHTE